jgi:hypothetical protein
MLDPMRVPATLRPLIPLAERFGVADDLVRERAIRAASSQERYDLVAAVRENDDALDSWLAGPEASGPNFSDEYVAFSAMRMAADYAV